MYCHDIPREYNLEIGQKRERPLPRECPLGAAQLSEAHAWTLAVVWEAGLSAGLHGLFVSVWESGSLNMDSDSLQSCVSGYGVKSSF